MISLPLVYTILALVAPIPVLLVFVYTFDVKTYSKSLVLFLLIGLGLLLHSTVLYQGHDDTNWREL